MAHRIYSEHNYHIMRKYEDETNEEDESRVVASTSTTTMEAAGGHNGGAVGCTCGRKEGKDESESDSEDDDSSDSSSDSDSSSSSSSSTSSESGPEEPSSSVPDEVQIPKRYSRGRRQTPFRFTQWQVEEMENLFEETHYPDMLTMEELARVLNVPEIKVKVWFVNRRAKQRKNERERHAMLRNMAPGVEDFISIRDVEEPS